VHDGEWAGKKVAVKVLKERNWQILSYLPRLACEIRIMTYVLCLWMRCAGYFSQSNRPQCASASECHLDIGRVSREAELVHRHGSCKSRYVLQQETKKKKKTHQKPRAHNHR
jgi:hypothetical protein